MKKYLLLLVLFCAFNSSRAQAVLKNLNPKGDFFEMARQINSHYDTASAGNRSFYKQWKRLEWFSAHHLDSRGVLANTVENNLKAIEDARQMMTSSRTVAGGDWISLGPSSNPSSEAKMGRTNSVAFDPVNAEIIYVATAGGGMWKSYNGGNSWENLTTDLPALYIADIVVSPAPNNHIVYALTGDLGGFVNVYAHTCIGVIKSFDGGNTWVRTGFTDHQSNSLGGYKLLMHPANPNILYAATTNGIRVTMDGGITWNNEIAWGDITDMEFKPDNPDILYFTNRGEARLYIENVVTGDLDWTDFSLFLPITRMEIAVTPHNPNAVYALCGPGYNFFGAMLFNGLFYSGNGGASFTMRSNSCNDNGDLFISANDQSGYDICMYVDPFNENYLVVGGVRLFNSVNGGVNLAEITSNTIHADQHNLKRNPLNGDIWLCNDGGVYRSTNSGNTMINKSNGMTIHEYYRISGSNNSDDRLIGGTQDNGHFLRNGSGFDFVLGGDGMDNYFNSHDNSIVYACTQNGGLCRSTNFGASFSNTDLPNSGAGAFYPWITPIVQQPPYFNAGSGQWENTDITYVYSLNGIMRGTGGTNWVNIGPAGIGQANVSFSPSMVICSDPGGFTTLYISNGNAVWYSFNPLDPNPAWISVPLPINSNTSVSGLAVNPANRSEIWASISGYQAGVKVFRSFNSGINWSPMTLGLPNVPLYSIVFGNNNNNPGGAVYVGTDIGVFYKNDNLSDWVPFYNNLPHVAVTDLQVNYVTGKLKAATYGRGIWETELYEPCPALVLANFPITEGNYHYESSDLILSSANISGGIGTRVTMKAGNKLLFTNGFRANLNTYFRAKIGPCGSGPVNLNLPNEPKETKTIQAQEAILPSKDD